MLAAETIIKQPNKIKNSVSFIDRKFLASVEGLDKRYTHCGYSNYHLTEKNRTLYEYCRSLNDYESITLTGKTGTGKTHLAVAILKNFPKRLLNDNEKESVRLNLEKELDYTIDEENKIRINELLQNGLYQYRKARCLFLPVVEMFLQLNEASCNFGDKTKSQIIDQFANYDCLCLDDLGAEKLTEASRQNLYAVIDRRYRDERPIVITSNFSIEQINQVEPRIASRLAEMGKILQFDGDDYRINNTRNL